MIAPDSATVRAASVIHRRLAERVERAQLRRREQRARIALVALHLVLAVEFLEQPQDALRARVVEMMDGEHCRG
jgi:hypothetical protein